jgi:hypothetical protein
LKKADPEWSLDLPLVLGMMALAIIAISVFDFVLLL